MALQEKIAAERADLFAFLRMLSADELDDSIAV
jgi:hypothetical protein